MSQDAWKVTLRWEQENHKAADALSRAADLQAAFRLAQCQIFFFIFANSYNSANPNNAFLGIAKIGGSR